MSDQSTIKLTVSEYIQRLSKELNIEGTKGLFGNELELIALVRNCQFLYNKTLPDFKNIQKKNEAWEAIASVFGVSVGEVQQRWKGMRDLFSKHKNKTEGNGPVNKSVVCPYYDDMKFLEPYIVGRRTRLVGVTSTISDQLNSDEDSIKEKELSPSFDDLKQFIMRIKSTPLLYHHKYSGGSFGKQKIDAWLEIANTFGVPVKECLARWRTLRERYSRERRTQKSGVSVKKWELYDELSFLDQHVKARRYTRMVPTNPSSAEQSVCYVITSPNSSSLALDSSSFLSEMSSTKKEVPIEDVEFFDVSSDITSSPAPLFNEENNLSEISISENATNGQSESAQSRIIPDEDDLFGQSIAAELKKLPCPRKKIKLKAEIYRLLYEHTCE
ncbi:transcription factor Adf-1-like isoform X2 [Zophobas morio]|uniref:transcription factor Adf-1-like isoform X2 n=1 Tax=Zophobas morio TaxID=2755281 RepID=UPI0030830757